MRSVRFLLSFAPDELRTRGELPIASAQIAHAAPAAGQLGDVVVATIAFEDSGRTTAAHGHLACAAGGAAVVRFDSREAARLVAFLEGGPAPVSVRPFAAAAAVPRDIEAPSEFPPAVSLRRSATARVVVLGLHAALESVAATLRHADVEVLHVRAISDMPTGREGERYDAAILMLGSNGTGDADCVRALRGVATAVLGVTASHEQPRMVDLFQAGLTDYLNLGDYLSLSEGLRADHLHSTPNMQAGAAEPHSSQVAARVLALIHRTSGHGARGAA